MLAVYGIGSALNAEMKDATKEGLHVKCQKEEKEFSPPKKKENSGRSVNLLGTRSAESLYTVYFYNVFLLLPSLFNAALHLGTFQNRPFYSCVHSYLAMNASEAGDDLALIQTFQLFSCKCKLVSIRTT